MRVDDTRVVTHMLEECVKLFLRFTEDTAQPDYEKGIVFSTRGSLSEVLRNEHFWCQTLLCQASMSMNNTGGTWDNIESVEIRVWARTAARGLRCDGLSLSSCADREQANPLLNRFRQTCSHRRAERILLILLSVQVHGGNPS